MKSLLRPVFASFGLAAMVAIGVGSHGASHAAPPAQRPAAPPAAAPPYADIADLVLKSPIIAEATLRSARRLNAKDAPDVPPGQARLLITADIVALLRGPDGVPPRVTYLLDTPLGADGRLVKPGKVRVLLFARAVLGFATQVQLVGRGAQRDWTPALDALTRRIATEAIATDAPPIFTGIGNAFHVPGSLPGEGETQIFLTTTDNRPASLTILRRPGERPRWSIALSEIIDEAAAPPAPDTLLWYRLACFLPARLPERSLRGDDADNDRIAEADYRLVLTALGPCGRTPPPTGTP